MMSQKTDLMCEMGKIAVDSYDDTPMKPKYTPKHCKHCGAIIDYRDGFDFCESCVGEDKTMRTLVRRGIHHQSPKCRNWFGRTYLSIIEGEKNENQKNVL